MITAAKNADGAVVAGIDDPGRLRISGMGWVTPLGGGVDEVWQRLLNGDTATAEPISSPLGPDYPVFRVPADATAKAPIHPRLRRSSAISRFAVVAGLEALANANVTLDSEAAKRVALIFAVSNGGVIYTKRFYHDIMESGAQAASPLLFPETVFNAPASHLAAILGITGASYTLVGDGAVGTLALKMAEDLMASGALDYCLVVGAEEADWLLCDAYRKWRLLRSAPPVEPFQEPARGTILSEGAGAILLSSEGRASACPSNSVWIERISSGTNFRHRSEAPAALKKVFSELCASPPSLVSASANGTFVDAAERAARQECSPNALVYCLKEALGESVGASSLWQVIAAAQALTTKQVPGNAKVDGLQSALISTCGLNQQVAGLRIAIP
jgi:3-oxoacyl-(acyl-carrier-protein) synthase